ncbi:MAG: Crp/Fnr family transcriptional regulator, partial [Phycisphaerae bacterium]|nr:Crp/Fnr family transcriptional regulator [Phycisphaerae bacterium]
MISLMATAHPTPSAIGLLLEDLELTGTAIRVPAGELLFGPQREPGTLYLISHGLFRVIDPPDAGRRLARTLAWLGPGEILGWNALVPHDSHRLWVRAERESRLIPLPVRLLARRMSRQPRLGIEIIAQLAGHLLATYTEASELIRLETPLRLAHCLR